MDEYQMIKDSKNPKVLTMLSGGKDSIAAVILLKKKGIDVTAIHFLHAWGSSIPTEEAKRICQEYHIPLIVKDYTQEFCEAVDGYTGGRPCLICKKQMYRILLEYLKNSEYGWICIGDNANDRTTIARIRQFIRSGHSEDTLIANGYMGTEMGIVLPLGIKVVRPLIELSAFEIETFLKKEGIQIRRIHSTGDKYFEYHREGCPIQFADIGVSLEKKLYDDLKVYNDCITEFARKNNILASIHMPSSFIITIPRGYEQEAASYLEAHGLLVDQNVNCSNVPEQKTFVARIYDLKKNLLETKAYEKVFNRFLERMELYGEAKQISMNEKFINCLYTEENVSFVMMFDFEHEKASINYSFGKDALAKNDLNIFDNLVLEMFRTRKYRVGMLVE